jgi:hypothetical protein
MSVTLHTDLGDIKIELYCDQCPKACEVKSQTNKLNILFIQINLEFLSIMCK